jgi:hypothetical protein
MWVLTDTTAPAGTSWRFEQVESRLAESQLLMYPGSAHPDFGFFTIVRMLTLVPAMLRMEKIPHNKTLKDVVPTEVYGRWRLLKTAYAPHDNDLERLRPSLAMMKLEQTIDERLTGKKRSAQPAQAPQVPPPLPGSALRPLLDKAAKTHKVKVRVLPDVEWKIDLKVMRRAMKFFNEGNMEVDANCINRQLEYLERRTEYLKKSAAGMAQEKFAERLPPCDEKMILNGKSGNGEVLDSAEMEKMFEEMNLQEERGARQLDAEWIVAAETALAKNKSTLAVLRISNAKGYIADLRKLGYEVEEPGSVVE